MTNISMNTKAFTNTETKEPSKAVLMPEELENVNGGRGFAALSLAAVLAFTTMAPMMAASEPITVYAAEEDPASSKAEDIILKGARDKGLDLLDKGLSVLLKEIPLGDCIKDLIVGGLGAVFGIGDAEPVTREELNRRLDALEGHMDEAFDEQTKQLIAAMDRSFTVGTYKADMQRLAEKLEIADVIKGSDGINEEYALSEEDQIVKLAMVAGDSADWDKDGFMMSFITVSNDMLGMNYKDNDDIFTALYNQQKDQYMFSGETLDAIQPYIQKMIMDYLRYTTIALASLDAQETLLSNDFDASKITDPQLRRQYERFMNSRSTIVSMKIKIARKVFGSDAFTESGYTFKKSMDEKPAYDNIMQHYAAFMQMDRLIHIPTGKRFNPDLTQARGDRLINNDDYMTQQFANDRSESTTRQEFEDRIQGMIGNYYYHNCIDSKQMEALFAHVSKQIAGGKYSSVLDYLQKMGFHTEKVYLTDAAANAKNPLATGTYFLTGGGYRENTISWEASLSRFECIVDVIDLNTGRKTDQKWMDVWNYKGISRNSDYSKGYGTYLMFHEYCEPSHILTNINNDKQAKQERDQLFNALADNFSYYYDTNEDLQQAFGNDRTALFVHFESNGIYEGRQISKYFDPRYYLDHNPDVKAAFGDDYAAALRHFLDNGVYEARSASEYYDDRYYAETYPDLANMHPYERFIHFLTIGSKSEGRFGSLCSQQEYEEQLRREEEERENARLAEEAELERQRQEEEAEKARRAEERAQREAEEQMRITADYRLDGSKLSVRVGGRFDAVNAAALAAEITEKLDGITELTINLACLNYYEDAARDTLVEAMSNAVGNARVTLIRNDVAFVWIGRTNGKADTVPEAA